MERARDAMVERLRLWEGRVEDSALQRAHHTSLFFMREALHPPASRPLHVPHASVECECRHHLAFCFPQGH